MKYITRKISKRLSLMSGMTLLLVGFQNCSGSFQTVAQYAAQSSSSSAGPGTGAASLLSAVVGWDPSTSANIQGYRIYLGTQPGTVSQTIEVGMPSSANSPQYELMNLDPTLNYYAVVTAYDSAGNEGMASNQIEISSQ